MKQKHHLLTMLKEAYSIFYIENPNIKIGFSKFCDLWPQKVELMQDVPHLACLYSYHKSVSFLLVSLSRYNKTKATEFHEFTVKFVCHSWERGPNQPTLHLVGWSHILDKCSNASPYRDAVCRISCIFTTEVPKYHITKELNIHFSLLNCSFKLSGSLDILILPYGVLDFN